jgi:hypothetical protein
MRFSVSIPFLAVLACGGSSPHVPAPDAARDAPPDTPTPTTTVTIDTLGEPDLIAFRDGDGPWQALPISGGIYTIEVRNPYVVAVVCDDGAGFVELFQMARSPDDFPRLQTSCVEAARGPSPVATVTGTMAQAGNVALGFAFAESTTPDWSFELTIGSGLLDLVADDGERAVFRRGLELSGETTVPRIDLAQEGFALVDTDAAITNPLPNETLSGQVTVFTQNFTFARFKSMPIEDVKLIPDGTLVGQERQRLELRARNGKFQRSAFVFRVEEASNTSFAVPDPLTGVTYTTAPERLDTAWSSLPAGTEAVTLLAQAFDQTTTWLHLFDVSAAYIADTNITSFAIDTAIPGFEARWRFDFDGTYFLLFGAHQFVAPSTTLSSEHDDAVNLAAPEQLRKRDELLARRYSSLRFASRNLSISAK